LNTIIWKQVPWYENYEINNIWECTNTKFNRVLKLNYTMTWYKKIRVSKNNIPKSLLVHRLVAELFIREPKENEQVNHKNWVKDDNRVENLEWCTASKNQKHRYDVLWQEWNNKWKFWKYAVCSKKVNQYSIDWKFIKTWGSLIDVTRQLWILWQNIWATCSWRQKSAGGFIWKYY